MSRTDLISPEYLATQKWLHAQPRGYGAKGDKWAPTVRKIAGDIGAVSILDYGAGQGSLARALKDDPFAIAEYDPAIPGKDGLPVMADLVVACDVLEHVEPERIDRVMRHVAGLTQTALFVVISTRETSKQLPDGRNAHVLVRPSEWWTRKLLEFFRKIRLMPCQGHKEFAALMMGPKP